MCKRPKSVTVRGRGNFGGRAGLRSFNLIEREDNQSEENHEQDEDNMILHIDGSDNQPFVKKG